MTAPRPLRILFFALLAALLASHHEECAAVVALLASEGRDGVSLVEMADEPECKAFGFERIREIVLGAEQDGFLTINRNGQVVIDAAHRYAIARVGAAAWLRAREGAPARALEPFERSTIRLHELARDYLTVGAWWVAGWAIQRDPIGSAENYRERLALLQRHGRDLPWPRVDVEAEVAAVWGPAGAGAPKGEQE